jgi:pyruvate dehydrogenase E2 component (dihydrolipoamide acetyltransferase)
MTPVLMPQIGQDILTGKIVEWRKKENDTVAKGEVIATVEGDKAAFDVESPAAGTLLKILFHAEAEAEVLKPIAYIGQPGEKLDSSGSPAPSPGTKPEPVASAPAPSPAPASAPAAAASAPVASKGRVSSSPSARRVARELGVSISGLTGTGPGGRIIKKDVLGISKKPAVVIPTADETIVFNNMRQIIADRLSKSKQTVPHVYFFVDVDMEEALAWRKAHNDRTGDHVTVTDIVAHAVAATLREYPQLNSHVQANQMIVRKSVNLGIATSIPDGLLVPVLKEADTLEIGALSREIKRISDLARGGKVGGGPASTFTITSLGMLGIPSFIPIINPPECGILAVGTAEQRVVAWHNAIAIRRMMSLTLACDHRGVDGAYAAQFLKALKDRLETDYCCCDR